MLRRVAGVCNICFTLGRARNSTSGIARNTRQKRAPECTRGVQRKDTRQATAENIFTQTNFIYYYYYYFIIIIFIIFTLYLGKPVITDVIMQVSHYRKSRSSVLLDEFVLVPVNIPKHYFSMHRMIKMSWISSLPV